MRKILLFAFAVALGGLMMFGGIKYFGFGINQKVVTSAENTPVHFTNYAKADPTVAAPVDFTVAAEKTIPAVVHIRSTMRMGGDSYAQQQPFDLRGLPDPFRDFFGMPDQEEQQDRGERQAPMRQGTGSGVIISSDGYIATNNHVVDNADEVVVTLNDRRSYTAKVIGVDPSTDVALIKIDEKDLPIIEFANSDDVKVGQWAVAVGNPFSLSSTVTAGIVSATSRNINIMQDRAPIESFIQTDAAVNPGNSGGALVDLQGNLIGINTAIASPTGSYSGYAFAVPSNMVNKVVADLKEFGVVQRGFIGALIRDVNNDLAEEKGLSSTRGIYVDSLTNNSAAGEAGIKVGDIIVAVDHHKVNASPELLERIGRHRPGDQVAISVLRGSQEKDVMVTLKNREGNTDPVTKKAVSDVATVLGAQFETLSKDEAGKMDVDSGVKVASMGRGKLARETDMKPGFVITKVNRQNVKSVEQLQKILENEEGGVMIEGKYPGNDKVYYYAFGL
ncbi:MAG: Do family serine endopeptidase [Saprospiraceae bacterium]|nr:Do family serine endopeptidase [Saprospiraceae bacterium]